jgi:hypothetical protein
MGDELVSRNGGNMSSKAHIFTGLLAEERQAPFGRERNPPDHPVVGRY